MGTKEKKEMVLSKIKKFEADKKNKETQKAFAGMPIAILVHETAILSVPDMRKVIKELFEEKKITVAGCIFNKEEFTAKAFYKEWHLDKNYNFLCLGVAIVIVKAKN